MREETPQPTMRVTDGSRALSMICTRGDKTKRASLELIRLSHTYTHTLAESEMSTVIHTHTRVRAQRRGESERLWACAAIWEEQTAL